MLDLARGKAGQSKRLGVIKGNKHPGRNPDLAGAGVKTSPDFSRARISHHEGDLEREPRDGNGARSRPRGFEARNLNFVQKQENPECQLQHGGANCTSVTLSLRGG